MEVEVFVHGVPNGESFWGKDEDRNYFGVFYDQSCSDKTKFLVQTRLSNGKPYCYYNYLVYSNVVGNEGRNGSYFGLSIRFDAYCKDFMSVYKVLDVVFCSAVVNKILKAQTGKYKYVISDFARVPDEMKNIYNRILELIQSALTEDSFCSLNGFSTNSKQLLYVNLYETSNSEVETMIREYGKIAISPYYQTNRERNLVQQFEGRMEAEKQKYEESIKKNASDAEIKIEKIKTDLSSLKTKNSSLEDQKKKLEETNKELKKNNKGLEDKIREYDRIKESIAIIEEIKEPVISLASTLGHKPNPDSAKESKVKTGSPIRLILPWVTTILGVIIIVMLIYVSAFNDTINLLRAENEELKYQLQTIEGSKGNTTTEDLDSTFATGGHSYSQTPARIDVIGYNEQQGAYLEKEKIYRASIKSSNNASVHKWSIKGGIINGPDNGSTVRFTPTPNDYDTFVELIYVNSEGDCVIRKLKVNMP